MQIRLNLPPGDGQQEFIDQFNAALRRISNGGESSGGFSPDGSFEAFVTGLYRLEPGIEPRLTWTMRKTPDGMLSTVAVELDQRDSVQGWDRLAEQLVESALAATRAVSRKRFFQRASYSYIGPALDGEYWLPGFRLGPAIPTDTEPTSQVSERWVDIDTNVDAIDATHAGALAGERARRIAARLSLLLDLGLERPPFEFRWVMVRGRDDTFENRRCQVMFNHPDQQPSAMPEQGALCPLGGFSRDFPMYLTAGRVRLPEGIGRVLRGADTRPHPIGDAFDGCARLYQVGRVVGKQFPSVFLAYAIAAVDAIVQADRSYRTFKDFMKTHLASGDDETNRFLNFLWGRARSEHFHEGLFPLGEFGPANSNLLMDPERFRTTRMRLDGVMAVRGAIIDWCLKRVAVEFDG